MTTNLPTCLIRQSDCGLQAGQTECPKCGIRSDARYVSKEDMEVALAKAKVAWDKSEGREAIERAKVEPVAAEKVTQQPGKIAPEIPKLTAEQPQGKQELPRSKPSRSIAYVIGGMLVLGSSSFAYFQHKESEAKLARAQQTLEEARVIALSTASTPTAIKFNDPVTPDRLKQIQRKKYVAPYFYAVLDELILAYPELIDLIFETKLIDTKNKQVWFDILPSMPDEQMSSLFVMLQTNRSPQLPQPPSNDLLQKIFNREMMGVTLSYLENITGPAKYSSNYKNEINNTYEVSGCSVDVRALNGSIMSLGLNQLSQKCSFNLEKFFTDSRNRKFPPIHNMTFGQFDSLAEGGKYSADCFIGCGNSTMPEAHEYWSASGAEGRFELRLGITLAPDSDSDLADVAFHKWKGIMVKSEGEDWVMNRKFDCTDKYNSVAKNAFKNVKITSVVIGFGLSNPSKC